MSDAPSYIPKPEDTILCTYPDTLDGFMAAWVVRSIMARPHKIAVEFQTQNTDLPDLSGRNWIDLGLYSQLYRDLAKSRLLFAPGLRGEMYTPPIPFKDWERTIPYGVKTMTVGSQGQVPGDSLGVSAWNYFKAERKAFEKLPRLIQYIGDSVSGDPKFNDTPAVVACIETYPRDFRTFDSLVEATDDRKRLPYIVTAGEAVLRYKAQQKSE